MSPTGRNKPAEFRVILEVKIQDDGSGLFVYVRLRRLLKRLLRGYGFRVKDIAEKPTE